MAYSSSGVEVSSELAKVVREKVLPGTGLDENEFWQSFGGIVRELAPRNLELLKKRDDLQSKIDGWFSSNPSADFSSKAVQEAHRQFLESIGYLVPVKAPFQITPANVDPEIATICSPQLVVPIDNARYALNACNARWGSLFDALYGTDVISEDDGATKGKDFNPARGNKVIAYANKFLDDAVPLASGSWSQVTKVWAEENAGQYALVATLGDQSAGLKDASCFKGFAGSSGCGRLLLRHNDLHIIIEIDREHFVGKTNPSGIKDLTLEANCTTIMDCEDSVTAVDAVDKAKVYSNWAELMRGELSATFGKGGKTMTRVMNPDLSFRGLDGTEVSLPGRSVMLIRNVGLHMMTDAVTVDAQEVPEGMLDAMVTMAAAKHDLHSSTGIHNSRTGSVYIVKPKMHGPEESAFVVETVARMEQVLGLTPCTVKLGVMDEERRTSANLMETLRPVADRCVFINTGFLDRTGDEIHTCMQGGPVKIKGGFKKLPWFTAYEDQNVDVGIKVCLHKSGQIGKGMWAEPDNMTAMMRTKIAHPNAGANTAWVPSPTASTLHALHYHTTYVPTVQSELASREQASLLALLTPPLLGSDTLSAGDKERELENSAQSMLGYMVRWIDQGVGCSKVPDINGIGLMEDRATLRISAQYLANWLTHKVVTQEQVELTFTKMAKVVDEQNKNDPAYKPMSANPNENIAFQAALEMVRTGASIPNGYTEHVLTKARRNFKDSKAGIKNETKDSKAGYA